MSLVQERYKSTRNSLNLKNIESSKTFRYRNTVVEIIVNNQLWGRPFIRKACRIILIVVLPGTPQGSVELPPVSIAYCTVEEEIAGRYLMVGEPQLLGTVHSWS